MAVSPTSLSSSAALLQDVRSVQSNSAKKSNFNSIVEQQQDNKSSSIAAQIQSQSASKLSQKIDIQVGDDARGEKKQLNLSNSIQREAPLAGGYQNQRPGSILDISV
ncbi:MAG: hypothetical protein KAR62_01710 [Sphingomonadales bacterium]|nr:hypothetical protein [Sphingomonadales bacterium]